MFCALAARLARAPITLLFCVCLAAIADEPQTGSETPPTSTQAKTDADTKAEFKPPPGFRPKKRGEFTVYCRRETVSGSRFSAEKCYDEAGIREMKRAELEQKEMLERIRACGSSSCSIT